MTAARDHQDMHRLVDRLKPTQVRRLRVHAAADPELHDLVQRAQSTLARTPLVPVRQSADFPLGTVDASVIASMTWLPHPDSPTR